MALQVVRPFFRKSTLIGLKAVSVRFSSHKPTVPINPPPNDHFDFKCVTLDDLPKPELDYYEDYRKNQVKYWRHFFIGTSFLAFTLWFMFYYEVVFWNAFPPELPPKEERIKSFWVEPEDDDDDDD